MWWRNQSSTSSLHHLHLLCANAPPSPAMQVLFKVKVCPLLLHQTGEAPPTLPPTPADYPKHVDQLVSTQFHLNGEQYFLDLNICVKCKKSDAFSFKRCLFKGKISLHFQQMILKLNTARPMM